MDITLILPPIEKKGSYNPFNPTPPFPPLGLALIAAVLEKNGYRVNIYDCEILELSHKDLIALIKRDRPKAIGITTLTVMIHRSLKTGQILKAKFPDIPIILGGPHVTIFPEETLKENKFVDFIVIGEGENTTTELLREIEKKSPDFSSVQGIGYMENGKVIINERRPFIKNIDELPLPARHLLPMKLYKPSGWVIKKPPGTHVIVSRGCPFRCGFCSKVIWGNTIRERSPEKVIEELLHLKEKYGINSIVFLDDIFTINRKRVLKICDLIKENKIDITWSCLTRVDVIDKELIIRMRESGCYQIGYGVESGNQEILDIMKKDITLKQIRYAFKLTQKAGLSTRAFIMFGLPGETQEMAYKTLNFVKEIDPDYANFYMYTPYPGTKLFEVAEKMGKIDNLNWSQYDQYSPNYIPNGRNLEEMLKIYKLAFRKIYLTSHYFKKRIKNINNLLELKKTMLLGWQFIRGIFQKRLR